MKRLLGALLLVALMPPASAMAGALPGGTSAPAERLGVKVFSATYRHFGSLDLEPEGTQEETTLTSQALHLKLMAGGQLKSLRLILSGALEYQLWTLSAQAAGGASEGLGLHAVHLRLAALKRLRGPWGLLTFVRLGVASDMADIAWRDLRTSVGAAVSYMPSRDLRLNLGLTYGNNLFGELVLPIIYLSYRTGPLHLNLVIPRGGSLWWQWHQRLELGLNFEAVSLRATLHDEPAVADELSTLNINAGLAARLYLYRGLYACAEGGYNVRYSELSRRGETTHSKLDWAGGYGGLSLGYMY